MQDAKTGGSRWVPDIREDEITEFQEQNGDETATYKAVNVHPIISRVLDKLAFFRTHVSAVWYNKLANKTVKDKLDEIDTSISSLNSNIIQAEIFNETVTCEANTQKMVTGYIIPEGYTLICFDIQAAGLNSISEGISFYHTGTNIYMCADVAQNYTVKILATYLKS